MNLPSVELLLVLGVIGFYLQDSAMLLYYDEIVVVQQRGRWFGSVGSTAQTGGRYLYVPNPFRPDAALFRSSWLRAGDAGTPEHWDGLAHFVAALRGFRAHCLLLSCLLFLGLPLLLWGFPHPLAMLALAAGIYLTTLLIGWRLWRYRKVLELQGRQALSLAFELLCCPPHAVNVVRRLCARRGLRGDAVDAAYRLLAPDQRRPLALRVGERLALAMDFHGDQARLLAARQRWDTLR
ncbi:hypothetical protein ABU614_07560 [Lysobacter firmicutimachus]|uniref:Uncharacterized protein n=1 Tax=Lysobacter firmicutimachus TaxID=1792846 RepID=A0AAU8MWH5_9GAMM